MNLIEREINESVALYGEDINKPVFQMVRSTITHLLKDLLEEAEGKRHPRAAGGVKGMLKRILEEMKV